MGFYRHNIFNKMLRHIQHVRRVEEFDLGEPVLNPDRIINRALYGTDYDPDKYKLVYKPLPQVPRFI